MFHHNSPLISLGRRRSVAQVLERGRPIVHVPSEFRIARSSPSKWVTRYRVGGLSSLEDRSSIPARRPTRLPVDVVELIEPWRREKELAARRIARGLADGHGVR